MVSGRQWRLGVPAVGVVLLLVGCAGAMAAMLWERGSDDAYITYTSVRNLVEHGELSFNRGERVFAQSDPGTALLLALLAVGGLSVPAAGTVLTALSLLALGVTGSRNPWRWLPAGMLLATSAVLWAGQGLGPVVATAFLAISAALASSRPGLAGLIAGFAVWCRPDAILGAGLIWLLVLGRERPGRVRYLVSCALWVALGLALAWLWWGQPLPGTFGAKRAFASWAGSGFPGAAWRSTLHLQGLWGPMIAVFGVAGLLLGWREPVLRALAAWGLVSFAFYSLAGLPYFAWYLAPLAVALMAGAGALPALAWSRGWRGVAVVAVVVVLAASWSGASRARELLGRDGWRSTGYAEVGRWMAAHSAPEAAVSATEIGYLGYYSQRRVVDLVGLVTPANVPFVRESDQLGAFLREPTELVMFHTFHQRGGTRPIVARRWFPDAYAEVARFSRAEWGEGEIILYGLIDQTAIPAPRAPLTRPAEGPGG